MDTTLMREARKKRKLTQDDLANHLGVKRAVISKYETGRIEPTIEQAKKISDFLCVPFLDLVGYGIDPDNDTRENRELLEKLITDTPWIDIDKLTKAYYFDENGIRFTGDNSRLERLIASFDLLTEEGQAIAADRIEELAQISKYRRKNTV